MWKTEIRVESPEAFFERGRKTARLADRGERIPASRIIAFEDAKSLLSVDRETTMPNPGDRCGARTRACRVETLLDTCSRMGSRASASVPARHARVRAPRLKPA